MIGNARSGYSTDWYPKKEEVIPRVYHEYLKNEDKNNIYTYEELKEDGKAYYVNNPEDYKVNCYDGTKVKLIDTKIESILLLPGSKTKNTIERRIFVKNTGKKDAYVRIHLAIPSCLDDAVVDPKYNFLHMNSSTFSLGQWIWSKNRNIPDGQFVASMSDYNYYTAKINGIDHNVYIITLDTVLKADTTSIRAFDRVYLDGKATDETVKKVNNILKTNKWELPIVVESIAVGEYEYALDAFKAKFGEKVYNPF